MFEIEKIYNFEAGHVLIHHDGQCAHPHGHSYILTVHLRGQSIVENGPKSNMLIDFHDISAVVKPMIHTYFDHKWLNDSLETESPTAEFIAQWIFEYLKPQLPYLYAISINETATSRATYKPDKI